MKFLTHILLFFTTLIFAGCGTSHPFNPAEANEQYITIGNGGGFTGKKTIYYITDKGEVYREIEMKSDFSYVGKIDKNFISQQWTNYKSMNIANNKLSDPGNMYFFLEFNDLSNNHKMMWGGNAQEVSPIVETMYRNIFSKIKKLN